VRARARLLTVLAAATLSVAGASPPAARSLRVPEDGDLAAALALAQPGDTVLVAPGTWPAGVALTSGVTLRADGPPGSAVLDGQGLRACVRVQDAAPGTRLEGFRLVQGVGEAETGATLGGALRVSGGRLEVRDCTFESSRADLGGGTAASAAVIRFERCSWLGTRANFGGGHLQAGGQLELADCDFTGTSASGPGGGGGGVCVTAGGRATVLDVRVRAATADADGAGMRFDNCVASVSGSLLRDNVAGGRGGGIAVLAGGQVVLGFSVLLGNRATAAGGGLFVTCQSSAPTLPDGAGGGNPGPAATLVADCASVTADHVDLVSNGGGAPAAGAVSGGAALRLSASVVALNESGIGCLDSRSIVDVRCTDLIANQGTDLTGPCLPALDPSNRALDPHFCSLQDGDLRLCANSPLLEPGCGESFWGAAGVGCADCGATSTSPSTWGRLKVLYRR
jgi:hypothetical protein